MEAAVRIDDVTKRFGEVHALRGVSLSVAPGEIFGLLGRNGAGKTTLVKILLDIVRPTTGSADLLGRSSRDSAARVSVGYLPEDHRFPDYRTGEGAMHFYAMLSGLDAEDRDRRVPELLELVDLRRAADRKVRGFSKGMKQRLGLAQALVHDPDLLFLDEPTDGVDPVGRAEIRDVLLELKRQGKTIFLNSHLLGEVERICDRAAILEEGRILQEGSLEELTASEGTVALRTEPDLDDDAVAALRDVVVAVERQPEAWELLLENAEDVDRVVDLLRSRGIGIRSLVPKKHSLEDIFLRALDPVQEAGA